MIVSSAPGRCGVIGNPTDLYGGSVISCSTLERAYCTLSQSDLLILCVEDYSEMFDYKQELKLDGSPLDIPKAILIYYNLTPDNFNFRLHAKSNIPERAGLAGSTALVIAVLGAVLSQLRIEMDPYTIAETARKIEFGVMGITCGYQDQHMAVFGGLNYMDFRGKEHLTQNIDEPYATVEPLQKFVNRLPIIVAHTGITRNSSSVHKSIRERWMEGEREVISSYERISQLARLGKKAILNGDWQRLGSLMNENHEIQRALGGSGEQNDILIEAALKSGAYGAKLAGAGKGGTIIALTLEPEKTVRALQEAGAERILWPQPDNGLTVETTWQDRLNLNLVENN